MRLNNIFAILTTLFVFAMPLSAAYGSELDPPSAGCVTYVEIINDNFYAHLTEQKGSKVELTGTQAAAFQSRVEETVGSRAPFQSDRIVIVRPNDDPDTIVNVVFFKDDCAMAILHLPPQIVDAISGPSVPLEEQGKI